MRNLQLVGEKGEVRAKLSVEESDGTVVLRLFDQEGTIRVKLGANENGSGLVLLDDQTEPGVQILADESGASLSLTGKDGRSQEFAP